MFAAAWCKVPRRLEISSRSACSDCAPRAKSDSAELSAWLRCLASLSSCCRRDFFCRSPRIRARSSAWSNALRCRTFLSSISKVFRSSLARVSPSLVSAALYVASCFRNLVCNSHFWLAMVLFTARSPRCRLLSSSLIFAFNWRSPSFMARSIFRSPASRASSSLPISLWCLLSTASIAAFWSASCFLRSACSVSRAVASASLDLVCSFATFASASSICSPIFLSAAFRAVVSAATALSTLPLRSAAALLARVLASASASATADLRDASRALFILLISVSKSLVALESRALMPDFREPVTFFSAAFTSASTAFLSAASPFSRAPCSDRTAPSKLCSVLSTPAWNFSSPAFRSLVSFASDFAARSLWVWMADRSFSTSVRRAWASASSPAWRAEASAPTTEVIFRVSRLMAALFF
mmetsp:Transcript_46797/g.123696  ORF Transcript_46797/g.123696 Transcript_46797/m.123696 type:complete len:414 (+) Transcript_46797:249-1490(+)